MEERCCGKKELELYFHIPFCVRKCFYCDFLSAPGDENVKREYMEALLPHFAKPELQGSPLGSCAFAAVQESWSSLCSLTTLRFGFMG